VEEAIDTAIQIAQGLAKAHEKGISHRDIKPANILVTDDGVVKILDFGLAKLRGTGKLTRTGSTLGTAPYMSPEQAKGEVSDQRTDLWSLGVLIYEMVTGQLPFKGEYEQAVTYQIINATPEPITGLRSNVPMDLERIVNKCLEKRPDERYQTAADLIADLNHLQRATGQSVSKIAQTTERPTRKKKRLYIIASVIAVVVLVVLAYFFWLSKPPVFIDKSIAVLPFVDMSPQKDQEYFCDGMTEELINRLSNIKELKVPARTSTFMFKGKSEDIREIGGKLNVSTVLEGSVRKAGNQLRIATQLINIADGYHLWSETYDRELKDVFAIQSDIAQQIAQALEVHLLAGQKQQVEKKSTENLEAYSLYLQGRYEWNKRTDVGIKKAIEHFTSAIEEDPTYALAYAGLSDAYLVLAEWDFIDPLEASEKIYAYTRKALDLDSNLVEAHATLAMATSEFRWDWVGAEREFKQTIKLNPHYATVHQWYAEYLSIMGRPAEALAEIKLAQELDPLSPIINTIPGEIYLLARQYDQVIAHCRKLVAVDSTFFPAHVYLGFAYGEKSMYNEAISEGQKAMNLLDNELSKRMIIAGLGSVFGKMGRINEAKKMLRELHRISGGQNPSSYYDAIIYLGLGDKNHALILLEKAVEEHRPTQIAALKVQPLVDPLRTEPRFIALLKKMGLEQ
jgi:TolB-like protein